MKKEYQRPPKNNNRRKGKHSNSKYTYEECKDVFSQYGYTLLSTEYKNIRSKLSYRCPSGHVEEMTFASFNQGRRCPTCPKSFALKYSNVSKELSREGITLLCDKLPKKRKGKVAYGMIPYLCKNGHKREARLDTVRNALKNGRGVCEECYNDRRCLTLEQVKEIFAAEGYKILAKEYKGNTHKLEYICPNGHTGNSTHLANFNSAGHRCPDCNGGTRLTIEQVREDFSKQGWKLLSKKYKRSLDDLLAICPNNHLRWISHNSLKCKVSGGNGCSICAGREKYTLRECQDIFKEKGFTLLSSEYINTHTSMRYICSEGHINRMTLGSCLREGRGNCPDCSSYGYNPNKTGYLYYVRFNIAGQYYYKIGITGVGVAKRFEKHKKNPPDKILMYKKFYRGLAALEEETRILSEHKEHLLNGPNIIYDGNTELFTKDVLCLDNV